MKFQRRVFRHGWVVGVAMATLLAAVPAHALAPQHEVTRLMLATEQAVADERWGEAGEYLNRLHALEAEKPAEYYYFRGRVMANASHYNEARAALENYVSMAGTESRYYRDALLLITEIEKAQKSQQTTSTNGSKEPVAVLEPAGKANVPNLRRRYGAGSTSEALVMHLNSLLESSAWRADQRIIREDTPPDQSYRITVQGSEIRIRDAHRDHQGGVVMGTEVLPVFGVNPMVRWGCEPAVSTCWVYDPRDGSRLLRLAMDGRAAAEIASNLGELIKALQAPR